MSDKSKGLPFTFVLLLLLGAQPVATDLYLPALPAIAREIGAASTSLTLFMLAFGVGQLVNGLLADYFGRRPILLLGLLVYAISAVGAAMAPTVWVLACFRSLQGLAMAAILVCARAAVRDLHDARDGPRIMAMGLSGLGVVALLAPLLGALVVQFYSWRWALACMAIYAVLVFAVCWFFFKETQQPDYAPLQGGTREVFSSRSFWAWSSVSATSFGGMFCFLLFSPAIYIEYLGLSPMAYGWIPASGSLVYILSTTWCRHLLSRHSVVRTVQWGSQLSLLGGLIQLAAGTWATHSFWVLLFGHWVFALGHGIHQPCGQAGAVSDFPKLAGRAVAWSGFVMMAVAFVVGQTLAPWMISGNSNGAWPLIVPMAVAGLGLVVIAYGWLPKAATPQGAS